MGAFQFEGEYRVVAALNCKFRLKAQVGYKPTGENGAFLRPVRFSGLLLSA